MSPVLQGGRGEARGLGRAGLSVGARSGLISTHAPTDSPGPRLSLWHEWGPVIKAFACPRAVSFGSAPRSGLCPRDCRQEMDLGRVYSGGVALVPPLCFEKRVFLHIGDWGRDMSLLAGVCPPATEPVASVTHSVQEALRTHESPSKR